LRVNAISHAPGNLALRLLPEMGEMVQVFVRYG
jgi:hypothetical protein